jgi:hypothetical protein
MGSVWPNAINSLLTIAAKDLIVIGTELKEDASVENKRNMTLIR